MQNIDNQITKKYFFTLNLFKLLVYRFLLIFNGIKYLF